ncbi:hypothetical protein TK90_2628 (plasmid) [Thioalkalivibrio sp. K90mix]|uniref:hypothetical protein n=1 Tax=Thioalkalivibrio sp. (strain K90mix) TaxID=396595 RepID=UPI000195AB90|nr:hypothetical protein [Thioalkalivibrio sp. K90mix]ADC73115.1 hypothetical protein TK90_2628 [Thioalkalivibrio sp. K90mix]
MSQTNTESPYRNVLVVVLPERHMLPPDGDEFKGDDSAIPGVYSVDGIPARVTDDEAAYYALETFHESHGIAFVEDLAIFVLDTKAGRLLSEDEEPTECESIGGVSCEKTGTDLPPWLVTLLLRELDPLG